MSVQLLAIISIVVGVIALFFGKQYYRIVLALAGIVLGWAAGHSIAHALNLSDTIQLIAGIVVAVLLAIFLYVNYGIAFVLFGAILGAALGIALIGVINVTGWLALIVVIVAAVLGAVVGSAVKDPIIIIASAFGGASGIVHGVGTLVPSLPLASPGVTGTNAIISLVVIVVLAIVGAVFQFRRNRG